ncbi:4-aminobutyrate--2-oxoglutarate transaminase [Janthinobacterium sp. B9-8]|uniref:4-aminobutyrate--2-oxoglutarate transaminase n=1 Tax=Janthinobacterium sp. B9-8 TaxID=1236179 RepID=UPI00061D39CC|nr:4-aminobutyrate--2-oxoglutarate transaminase [Janthinobacterium sp. B9-8]AMC36529.1 4-aminobutyrate--2-oxoglutarate transaminase [Janthinobacterium sp. B9-8]
MDWNDRRLAATPRGVGISTQVFIAKAKNAEVWDIDGRRYIDFAAGIAVLNTGHLHPKIKAAVSAQLDAFSHSCYQVMPYTSYVALAEKLNQLAPISGPCKSFFLTTGAEAVENAVKIARVATGRAGVIAFSGGFHGRTLMGMALTGKVAPYKIGFGPFPADVYHAPFPSGDISSSAALASLKALFKSSVDPKRIAAMIIEPVQGEGGFYPVPHDFMRGLRQICDEHGILLIADEIQTGFARTGKLFAMEHFNVEADLITIAKSLAGGFPLSGVIGRAALMDAAAPGGLGGTYGGSPIGIAAALAVLEIIEEEQLCTRANIIGSKIKACLEGLKTSTPQIHDIRGLGAMVAVEFTENSQPSPEFTAKVKTQAQALGLILLSCGMYGNVIRFLCPLTIEDKILDEALGMLDQAVKAS